MAAQRNNRDPSPQDGSGVSRREPGDSEEQLDVRREEPGASGQERDASQGLYRRLPSVDLLLEDPAVDSVVREQGFSREFLRRAANRFLDGLREEVADGRLEADDLEGRLAAAGAGVAAVAERLSACRLRRVVNATGVVVHTNLGRSPWSREAAGRVAAMSQCYLDLEFDLEGGGRGGREAAVEHFVAQILPGAGVCVVNNNAAAVLLVLNTFAEGREVVVSRGQLVEIGGSFRIPEVMKKAQARLVEVGTTNRTRLADYEDAAGPDTGLLMAVHPSNYRVVGFTEEVPLAELVGLARRLGVPMVEDMGSGNLLDLSARGIDGEPVVGARLATGVDLVTFSGDKLLGGPQAGLVVGRPELVAKVRENHLYRALRVDKGTLLALEATLAAWATGGVLRLPTVRMVDTPVEELTARAESLAAALRGGVSGMAQAVEVVECVSRVGGGAAPGQDLPSRAVAVDPARLEPSTGDTSGLAGADELAARLRRADIPVVGRISDDRLLLDVRTLLEDDGPVVVAAFAQALGA